ncbi:MAG: choice-of-anchor D domain-containing protein [Solirubrobacterales bacterium]|nr:choice-of-anchor D domain-containing protein [Solirubrobacterales bacterium]
MARIECAKAGRKLAPATALVTAALLILASGASASEGVVVHTPSLDFGRGVVSAASSATQHIELYNATSSTLQLTSMQLTGGISDFVPSFTDGTTCPTPGAGSSAGVAPGATCVVAVTYTPSTLGSVSGSLTMTFCPADSTTCTTTSSVSLSADGVHAETLTLNPGALSFTSTALGATSATQVVTLTNGPEPMSITQLSLGGTAPNDFWIGDDGCTGTDLSAGASCSFDIRFAPSLTGTRTATVTVVGATLGNPYPALTLTGIGSAPDPIVPTASSPPSTPGTPSAPAASTTATTGSTAPQGAWDQFVLVTCRPAAKPRTRAAHTVELQRCTGRRLTRSVNLAPDQVTAQATISRGRVVYAAGSAISSGARRWQLRIHRLRALRPGVYTLTLGTGRGARRLMLTVT